MMAKHIVQGVYVVPLGPVNVFLLESKDGLLLIDTGTPGSAGQIL
jgi:glyoxylase-like metal-dependent hydrolase (beta-lactamase superfamily II)